MASFRQNSQLEGSPRVLRRMTSTHQDGQSPRTLRRMASMFQDGQNSAPGTLRRMASMFHDGQFEQTSSPRMLRRTTSTYQDGHYEVPRSPRMLTKMPSVYQEARSPARPRRMTALHSESHFETAPRMARQMPTSLYPDDLLAPPMARSPLPRRGSFYDGSQFEGGGNFTQNGFHQECSKLSPSTKMASMFAVAHSMERIKSFETNKGFVSTFR